MLFVTTEPAPMTQPRPMLTLGRITLWTPMKLPRPIRTKLSTRSLSREPILGGRSGSSNGCSTSTITQYRVIETSSSIVTRHWQIMWAPCSMFTRSPIARPGGAATCGRARPPRAARLRECWNVRRSACTAGGRPSWIGTRSSAHPWPETAAPRTAT